MIARSPDVLFCDLYDLQRAGVMVDTRLILDDGELAIHWSMLDLFGYEQWWTCWFDWEEGKKKYKFQESKNKLSRTQQFTTIDFTEKKDLFHFVANEPVGFIFKFKKRK